MAITKSMLKQILFADPVVRNMALNWAGMNIISLIETTEHNEKKMKWRLYAIYLDFLKHKN